MVHFLSDGDPRSGYRRHGVSLAKPPSSRPPPRPLRTPHLLSLPRKRTSYDRLLTDPTVCSRFGSAAAYKRRSLLFPAGVPGFLLFVITPTKPARLSVINIAVRPELVYGTLDRIPGSCPLASSQPVPAGVVLSTFTNPGDAIDRCRY